MHVGQVLLREVGLHPEVAVGHQGHGGVAGADVLARLRHLADAAGQGCTHLDPLQVQLRLVQFGQGGAVAGVLLDGQVETAAEVLGDAPEVVLAGVDLLRGHLRGLARFV
ncbi:hypothetical protein D3C76_1371380 [compost metagenome]